MQTAKGCIRIKAISPTMEQRARRNLSTLGFQQSKSDQCLFTKGEGDDTVHMAVYVDDMLVSASNGERISKIVEELKKGYEVTNLGEVNYFLGVEVTRDNDETSNWDKRGKSKS